MNTKRIVITGGPGTGKSSVIDELKSRNYTCVEEVSRQVTLDARKDGIEQLFLTKPLLFSELLIKARLQQFNEVNTNDQKTVFMDRGLPDILGYMDYIGESYPNYFISSCETHRYDQVFILVPWKAIFKNDNERYETFDQAVSIHKALLHSYEGFGYVLIDVPFTTVSKRTDFILDHLNL